MTSNVMLRRPGRLLILALFLFGYPYLEAAEPRIEVLAWVAHADADDEWRNTVDALGLYASPHNITETSTDDPALLEADLAASEVLLLPEQESWSGGAAFGAAASDVLRAFVERGGVVVALAAQSADIVDGAGLLELESHGRDDSATFEIVAGGHPLLEGVTPPVVAQNATYAWTTTDPLATVVLERPLDGASPALVQEVGAGAVVVLGYDFYHYDDNAARILANAVEVVLGVATDTDEDGLLDGYEIFYGLDPEDPSDAGEDPDGDGLTCLEEFEARCHPREPDTDGDGLLDGVEVKTRGTNPRREDTDGDGLLDGVETGTGTFVDADDTGTDPLDPDTDGNGMTDGEEVAWGLDPTDPTDDLHVEVLAWVTHADPGREWPNTRAAIDENFPFHEITETTTTDPALLEAELASADVFLLPEQEGWGGGAAFGASVADVLLAFVERGGLIVAMAGGSGEVVSGAGLLELSHAGGGNGTTFDIIDPAHPLLEGVTPPIVGRNATDTWTTTDPLATIILEVPGTSASPVLMREIGGGGVIVLGYDFFDYDDNAARILSNSIAAVIHLFTDTDEDGIPDGVERHFGLDPEDPSDAGEDLDGDGLTNLEEFQARCDPTVADSDGDGLSDGVEVKTRGTDPRREDTDGDGLSDGVESGTGTFVDETDTGSDPLDPDTDGSGMTDGAEVAWGLDPTDPSDDIHVEVLAWVAHADFGREWPNTRAAIDEHFPFHAITETTTTDPTELEAELATVDVFLLPEQEGWSGGAAFGASIADVLTAFVERGGVVVAMAGGSGELVAGAGLLDLARAGGVDGVTLEIVEPDHLLLEGVTPPVVGRNATDAWTTTDPLTTIVLRRPGDAGSPALMREIGAGGVIVLGYDFFEYDDNAAHILTNAVLSPLYLFTDTDGDGMPDGFEAHHGLDPEDPSDAGKDPDGDGLTSLEEFKAHCNPQEADTDGDGLDDGLEVRTLGTSPRLADTDGDGLLDGVETGTGTFVDETDTGSDPLDPDTDGNGMPDGVEVAWGLDPNDPSDDVHVEILAWVAHADFGREWPNTVAALTEHVPFHAMTETTTTDPALLEAELATVDVFLLPEQEGWSGGAALGASIADVLTDFVERGGVVIALLGESGLLVDAAGLLDLRRVDTTSGGTFEMVDPAHPLLTGVTPPVVGQNATDIWLTSDPDATIVLERAGDGASPALTRQIGAGGVIALGYDFFEYDDNAARILSNAVGAIPLIFPSPEGPFLRGDADGSGRVNVTDPVRILNYLFKGGDVPPILDAADADDDGSVSITDAIQLLRYLFRGGEPPAAPFPDPGLDPTEDDL